MKKETNTEIKLLYKQLSLSITEGLSVKYLRLSCHTVHKKLTTKIVFTFQQHSLQGLISLSIFPNYFLYILFTHFEVITVQMDGYKSKCLDKHIIFKYKVG